MCNLTLPYLLAFNLCSSIHFFTLHLSICYALPREEVNHTYFTIDEILDLLYMEHRWNNLNIYLIFCVSPPTYVVIFFVPSTTNNLYSEFVKTSLYIHELGLCFARLCNSKRPDYLIFCFRAFHLEKCRR
jgi:hypothetical protein